MEVGTLRNFPCLRGKRSRAVCLYEARPPIRDRTACRVADHGESMPFPRRSPQTAAPQSDSCSLDTAKHRIHQESLGMHDVESDHTVQPSAVQQLERIEVGLNPLHDFELSFTDGPSVQSILHFIAGGVKRSTESLLPQPPQ